MKSILKASLAHIIVLAVSMTICCASQAATATTTFQVTATVISSCAVSASDLTFGNYNVVTGTEVSGTTTVSVICSSGTTYEIALDAGIGSGATVATRKMTGGAEVLNYSLYSEATNTTVWGDTASVDTVGSTGTGSTQNFTIYGLITANQSVSPGAYSDTITITVTF